LESTLKALWALAIFGERKKEEEKKLVEPDICA